MSVHQKNINIAEVVQHDIDHHFHPFTDHKAFHAAGGPRVITHADGVYIWDGKGNKILDGFSGLWCVNVGYGRKELAEVAYRQMLDLPYYNTFFKTTTVPTTELAAKISSVLPKRFQHIFFTNSGSESNDTIVRFVRHYWKLKGKPYRQHFIGRVRGYHGSTMVAANLGGMAGMHEQVAWTSAIPSDLLGLPHMLGPMRMARTQSAICNLQSAIALGRGHAPGSPRLTSCSTQVLPSGSLKSANEW